MRDLEIRGAGNLLGAEQHGHIAAVGFDTYLRLLGEAVAEMKGTPPEPERDVRIDLPVKAFVPAEWVGQEALRLELYRRIATARDHDDLASVRTESEDRFGGLPPSVQALFAVASLKLTAMDLGVEEITTFRKQLRIKPIAAGFGHELHSTMREASFHSATGTLNLDPQQSLGGEALARWVEGVLAGGRAPEPAKVETSI
jgi:transcription-repair coupling factor (superfamily II helicase)